VVSLGLAKGVSHHSPLTHKDARERKVISLRGSYRHQRGLAAYIEDAREAKLLIATSYRKQSTEQSVHEAAAIGDQTSARQMSQLSPSRRYNDARGPRLLIASKLSDAIAPASVTWRRTQMFKDAQGPQRRPKLLPQ